MKQQWEKQKQAKEDYKDKLVLLFLEREEIPSSLDEIKLEIAKILVADKKLPTMGKVRSYTLYVVLTLKLPINELDLYKII
jgi:hypothetical protein